MHAVSSSSISQRLHRYLCTTMTRTAHSIPDTDAESANDQSHTSLQQRGEVKNQVKERSQEMVCVLNLLFIALQFSKLTPSLRDLDTNFVFIDIAKSTFHFLLVNSSLA